MAAAASAVAAATCSAPSLSPRDHSESGEHNHLTDKPVDDESDDLQQSFSVGTQNLALLSEVMMSSLIFKLLA